MDVWKREQRGTPIPANQWKEYDVPLARDADGSTAVTVRYLFNMEDREVCPDTNLLSQRQVLASAGWLALPLVLCVALVPGRGGGGQLTRTQVEGLQRTGILAGCRGLLLDVSVCPVNFPLNTLRALGWVPYMKSPIASSVTHDGLYLYLTPMGHLLNTAEEKTRALRQSAALDTSGAAAALMSAPVIMAPAVEMLATILGHLPEAERTQIFQAGTTVHGRYGVEGVGGDIVVSKVWAVSSNRYQSELLLLALRLLAAGLAYADPQRYGGGIKIPGDSIWYADAMNVQETFLPLGDEEDEDLVATSPDQFRQLRPMPWPPVKLSDVGFDSGDRVLKALGEQHAVLTRTLFDLRFPSALRATVPQQPPLEELSPGGTARASIREWTWRRLSPSYFARRVSDRDHLLLSARHRSDLDTRGWDTRPMTVRLAWRAEFWDHCLSRIHAPRVDLQVETRVDVRLGLDARVVVDWLRAPDPMAFESIASRGNYYGFFAGERSALSVMTNLQCNVRDVALPMLGAQPDVLLEYLIVLFDLHYLLQRLAQNFGLIVTLSKTIYDSFLTYAARADPAQLDRVRLSRFAFVKDDPERNAAVVRDMAEHWKLLWTPLDNDSGAADEPAILSTYVLRL